LGSKRGRSKGKNKENETDTSNKADQGDQSTPIAKRIRKQKIIESPSETSADQSDALEKRKSVNRTYRLEQAENDRKQQKDKNIKTRRKN